MYVTSTALHSLFFTQVKVGPNDMVKKTQNTNYLAHLTGINHIIWTTRVLWLHHQK